MSKERQTSDNYEQGNSSLGVVRVRCNSCGNEQDAGYTKDAPIGTKTIVDNYCPNCEHEHEGDYYETLWFEDDEGNEL